MITQQEKNNEIETSDEDEGKQFIDFEKLGEELDILEDMKRASPTRCARHLAKAWCCNYEKLFAILNIEQEYQHKLTIRRQERTRVRSYGSYRQFSPAEVEAVLNFLNPK